jgi:hypothetical protein
MILILASGSSTVVEHLPHHQKVEGSSPTTLRREIIFSPFLIGLGQSDRYLALNSPRSKQKWPLDKKTHRRLFNKTIKLIEKKIFIYL